jgi:hypothetical protein
MGGGFQFWGEFIRTGKDAQDLALALLMPFHSAMYAFANSWAGGFFFIALVIILIRMLMGTDMAKEFWNYMLVIGLVLFTLAPVQVASNDPRLTPEHVGSYSEDQSFMTGFGVLFVYSMIGLVEEGLYDAIRVGFSRTGLGGASSAFPGHALAILHGNYLKDLDNPHLLDIYTDYHGICGWVSTNEPDFSAVDNDNATGRYVDLARAFENTSIGVEGFTENHWMAAGLRAGGGLGVELAMAGRPEDMSFWQHFGIAGAAAAGGYVPARQMTAPDVHVSREPVLELFRYLDRVIPPSGDVMKPVGRYRFPSEEQWRRDLGTSTDDPGDRQRTLYSEPPPEFRERVDITNGEIVRADGSRDNLWWAYGCEDLLNIAHQAFGEYHRALDDKAVLSADKLYTEGNRPIYFAPERIEDLSALRRDKVIRLAAASMTNAAAHYEREGAMPAVTPSDYDPDVGLVSLLKSELGSGLYTIYVAWTGFKSDWVFIAYVGVFAFLVAGIYITFPAMAAVSLATGSLKIYSMPLILVIWAKVVLLLVFAILMIGEYLITTFYVAIAAGQATFIPILQFAAMAFVVELAILLGATVGAPLGAYMIVFQEARPIMFARPQTAAGSDAVMGGARIASVGAGMAGAGVRLARGGAGVGRIPGAGPGSPRGLPSRGGQGTLRLPPPSSGGGGELIRPVPRGPSGGGGAPVTPRLGGPSSTPALPAPPPGGSPGAARLSLGGVKKPSGGNK